MEGRGSRSASLSSRVLSDETTLGTRYVYFTILTWNQATAVKQALEHGSGVRLTHCRDKDDLTPAFLVPLASFPRCCFFLPAFA